MRFWLVLSHRHAFEYKAYLFTVVTKSLIPSPIKSMTLLIDDPTAKITGSFPKQFSEFLDDGIAAVALARNDSRLGQHRTDFVE